MAAKYGLIYPPDLPIFHPNNKGSHSVLAKLTQLSANQVLPLLELLLRESNQLEEPKVYSIEEFSSSFGNNENEHLSKQLAGKFSEYGSDKSTAHNYHFIYASILGRKNEISGLLEIGLGTNNPNFVSNMGVHGQPGASLRAFRDVLPNAFIYGADIDKSILFAEDRIKTFFVDQTRMETFEALQQAIPHRLDLIIDDGLHAANANLATLVFALRMLDNEKGGTVVIEDIPEEALSLWKLVANLLHGTNGQTYLVKACKSYVFVCDL